MVAIPLPTQPTVAAIDNAVEEFAKTRFSHTIGGSTIGHSCERFLWYKFRWSFAPEQFSGRMLRLFETGHIEEARMIGWLKQAGLSVEEIDTGTGDQWQVLSCDGHFKGFADGIIEGVKEAPTTKHLLECKTHNLKSFEQLKKVGVAAAKPEHVAQCQVYMHLLGLSRAFYLAKCKDNDELYSERIEYDVSYAIALISKAERIIEANEAPPPVSDNPDYFLCKAFKCPAYDLCRNGMLALRNCRTCLHSTPINDGQWHCQRHDRELSIGDQNAGCPSHLYLPSLVNGEQVDVDETQEIVTYKLSSGETFHDGGVRP